MCLCVSHFRGACDTMIQINESRDSNKILVTHIDESYTINDSSH